MIRHAVTRLPSAVAPAALVALSVLALWEPNSSATAQQPASNRDRTDLDPLDPAIREIQQVREQLQLDPLKGTMLQRLPDNAAPAAAVPSTTAANGKEDAIFADALRRVMARARCQTCSGSCKTSETTEFLRIPLRPIGFETPSKEDAAGPETPPRSVRSVQGEHRLPDVVAEDQTLSRLLRATGRQLDNRANDLEDRCEYATADRLRNLANALRREARLLNRSYSTDP